MSDITIFANDCASLLLSKRTLNGISILTTDRHDLVNELNRSLAELGTAIIIGTPRGTNDAPDSPGLQETLTLTALVMENVVLNRGRAIFATVNNDNERFALAGTVPGHQIVEQTNIAAGQFKVAYEGYVSEQVDLAVNASELRVAQVLNGMNNIAEQGRVTVTGSLAAGYTATWTDAGPRSMMQPIKGMNFAPGVNLRIERVQAGNDADPEIQQILVRQRYWLVGGTGAFPSNWGYLLVGDEILQLAMRALHSFRPVVNQTIVAKGFRHRDSSIVQIAADFSIRLYMDSAPVL